MAKQTDQQTAELDALRTQVAEVTQKAKDRKARITELETANADLTAKLTASDAALTEATVGKPLRDLAAALSPVPELWQAEFSKHYKLEMRDGKLTVLDSKGEPVKVEDKPVEFTAAAISKLVTTGDSDEAKVFAHITAGSLASGGGASGGAGQGGNVIPQREPQKRPAATPSPFGLR